MIIINSPHNPSGAVWSAGDLERLAELVRDTNIVIVSDEVYEHIVFDGVRHVGLSAHAELRQRSFVVSSFGKTFHITGWKIAYCLAPRELMSEFRKAHQFVVFVVNHPMQLALADFMREQPQFARELAAFYQGKRDFFRAQLAGSRFELLPCAATYFQMARYAAISEEPDTQFAQRLTREHGVAVIPVSVFSPQGDAHRLVRFCFAKNDKTLAAAGECLRQV